MNRLILLTFILTLLCNVAWAAKLTLKSRPAGAEVFIHVNGKSAKIGVTPFDGDLTEIMKTYAQSNSFMFELKKEGHVPYRVLLARTNDVDLELAANLELDPAIDNVKEHDSLMNKLFSIQKLVRSRNFQDALEQLSSLEKKYPDLSIIPEMKATTYYMNKDVESALSYYRRAFAVNPENQDAYRMKLYLEKKLNVDSEVP